MSETVASLLGLEQQLRKASDLAQLFYTLVNQTHRCVPFTQALLLIGNNLEHTQIVAASDIPTVDYTSPYISWAERLSKELVSSENPSTQKVMKAEDFSDELAAEWRSLGLPAFFLWQPLMVEALDNQPAGALLLFRDQAWSDAECEISLHIGNSAGHALFALRRQQSLFRGVLPRLLQRKTLIISLTLLVLFIPVRLSTLAPVEVIPKDPYVVAAPLDGVVETVTVLPNQAINKGDLLAQIETNELKSEEAITHQALLVAQAELKTVQQSGFMDPRQKSRFAELEAQVKLRLVQWQYAQERLSRAEIVSNMAGVAVLGDPSEWKGRPVKVGERIFLVADPEQVEFEVMLPVKDSIALLPEAEVRVFLDNDPIRAWSSKLKHATYEPRPTSDQQVAYRLVVSLLPHEGVPPRIGLRGTAKIYGERVSLFFYLFRRPITSFRQWLGW